MEFNKEQIFMELCKTLSQTSKCLSRKVGAVIVNPQNVILSCGYNGPPRKTPHCGDRYSCDDALIKALVKKGINPNEYNSHHPSFKGKTKCPRQALGLPSGEGLQWCTASHAECNAIYQAAMVGGTALIGSRMYINALSPCGGCMKAIIQAGIIEVICFELKWYDEVGRFLANTANIRVRNYTGTDPLER